MKKKLVLHNFDVRGGGGGGSSFTLGGHHEPDLLTTCGRRSYVENILCYTKIGLCGDPSLEGGVNPSRCLRC